MEPQQLALRDIHLPETLGWWPPAIGWWLLALIIPLTGLFVIWLYKRITRKTALKTAKKLLASIKKNTDLDDKQKLIQLSALLRRVAISTAPRNETASLTGQAWLEYLDSSVKNTPFTSGAGHILANLHFQPSIEPDVDISAVIHICEQWLDAQKSNK